jgi:erythromycin esterase
MKHRLLEFLVEEMGFNTFAMEAPWAEAELVNNYVQSGEGDPRGVLAGMRFWTWNTEEVLDLILWMRRYNERNREPRVSFHGFDMQSPVLPTRNVLDYLEKVDPDAHRLAQWRYECYAFESERDYYDIYRRQSAVAQSQCRAYLARVHADIAVRQSEYEAKSSPKAYAHALQSARVVVQSAGLQEADEYTRYMTRDRAMAENASWLLEQAGPRAKIVLWAHNGHVQTEYGWMGGFLREKHGEQMVVFGFAFNQGSFHASDGRTGVVVHTVGPAPNDSYEALLGILGPSRLILDLRRLRPGSREAAWFAGPHPMRMIGGVYGVISDLPPDHPVVQRHHRSYFRPTRLSETYDVIIYFQDTTPTVPVR